MRRAVNLLVPIIFILAVIAPGCYTVIVHPTDEGGYKANQTSDCVRCHDDYHSYPYGYYYSPYPSYWWEHDRYGYYYAYPWWWSYYEYPYLGDDYGYQDHSAGRSTKFDRREVSRQPAPPPHSIQADPRFGDELRPGMYDLPAGYYPGTTTGSDGTGNVSRPSSESSDSTSRSRDSGVQTGDGKSTRQSDTRGSQGSAVQQDNPPPASSGDSKPPEPSEKTDDNKKKTRREGRNP